MSIGERLFVYGTLRSDIFHQGPQNRAQIVLERDADLDGPAWVDGHLYAVRKSYPGYAHRDGGRVRGQVRTIREPGLLTLLDEYEGRAFHRQPHLPTLDDGRRVTAWLYMYNRSLAGVPRIASGDYLEWIRNAR